MLPTPRASGILFGTPPTNLSGVRGTESDIESSQTAFKVGDIFSGKLRPGLRKGAQTAFNGINSTDVSLFRAEKSDEHRLPNFFTIPPPLSYLITEIDPSFFHLPSFFEPLR
jgi:hypothetical protein